MSRLAGLAWIAMLPVLAAGQQGHQFSKYKAVEAYEIRSGVLMIPRYSSDGQVCEIGLERLHYSPEIVRLESGLSRKEIDQIVDELVPIDERGPRTAGPGESGLTVEVGNSTATTEEYENVSVKLLSSSPSDQKHERFEGYSVAIINWKHRKCQ